MVGKGHRVGAGPPKYTAASMYARVCVAIIEVPKYRPPRRLKMTSPHRITAALPGGYYLAKSLAR